MKNVLLSLVTALAMTSVVPAMAEEGHGDHEGHGENQADLHASHHAVGKETMLKGELIGLTCFVKHGSMGGSHKSCAKDCAMKGLPIGILSDGQIYQISGDGHDSLVEAYKPLLKYMESKIMIKGEVFEKNGLKMVVIKKIKNE